MTSRLFKFIGRLIIASANLYSLGLLLYLIIRFTLGDRYWPLAMLNNFAPFYFLPLLISLVLFLIVRARRSAAFASILLAIALVWFGPRFIPKAQAASAGTVLNVVTFNSATRNQEIHLRQNWLRETAADIVLLQEIRPADARDNIPALRDIYPYQFGSPESGERADNVILSRYPLAETADINLSSTTWRQDDAADVQRAVIEVGGRKIALYNIHLSSPSGYRHNFGVWVYRLRIPDFIAHTTVYYDDRIRNGQIYELMAMWENEPYPLIVGGDFNTSEFTRIYQEIDAHLDDSFREAGYGMGFSWPVAEARNFPVYIPPVIRIDYLWHSPEFQTIRAEQAPYLGSDHLALTAALAFDS
jgi:vancomycin resistance protein VanJ